MQRREFYIITEYKSICSAANLPIGLYILPQLSDD
jgi:dihydrodipicolinate synthase/N-acetylneuraminate lyase